MKNNYLKLWIALGVFFACLLLLSNDDLHAKDTKDKIKEGIQDVSDFFKKEVDKISGDIESVQNYFDRASR